MKNVVKKIYWLVSMQFGFDPRRMLRSFRGIPRFLHDWFLFRKGYKGRLDLRPCLYDWYEEGGSTKDEYFLQDLHVARQIYAAMPKKHVDIGSRIDGFVTHVASYRNIEIFDIRPVTASIPGVIFKQADLMTPSEALVDYCDSLSCLHALEHFGLGRYGDPIDPQGYVRGLKNMAQIVQPGGLFYLSVPIGIERVVFNANRIFDPNSLLSLAASFGLLLKEFSWIDATRLLTKSVNATDDLNLLSQQYYALGLFTFVKNKD